MQPVKAEAWPFRMLLNSRAQGGIHILVCTANASILAVLAAVVCRDAEGNYLGSSSLVIHGINDVATLEAIACREALFLALYLMLHSFIVASDSKVIVKDIQSGSNAAYGNIVREISNEL